MPECLDDLVHTLVAQAERVGDLPQGGPPCVEAADLPVVCRARLLQLALERQQPLAGVPGLAQGLLVQRHVAQATRCFRPCLHHLDTASGR
jgi:hypothetical protein